MRRLSLPTPPEPSAPAQPSLNRRRLLQGSGTLMASSFVSTLGALHSRQAQAQTGGGTQLVSAASPYGPIAPVADLSTGLPLLQLPAGFSYRSYGWTGDPMRDGRPTPSNHDGMALVRAARVSRDGRGTEFVLVRNHERGLATGPADAIQAPQVYAPGAINGIITIGGALTVRVGASGVVTNPAAPDPTPFTGVAGGGTTNLVFRNGQWVDSYASIGGTLGNCAGGPTPWGSWLTCEETVFDFSPIGGRKHGYVFESAVDANASLASPIVGMGRFVHEAVAVDPATGIVYETEDNRNAAALYRYVPVQAAGGLGSLQQGGVLQAARIRAIVRQAQPLTLTASNNQGLLNPQIGDEYELEWVNIADPDADPRTVVGLPGGVALAAMAGPTLQAMAAGCARMSRGEGIWFADGKMFIVDTGAGVNANHQVGQGEGAVWELNLATMRLRALFVSGAATAGNNPDNITVSPRGGLLLCEDGGASPDAFGSGTRLLGLNAAGQAYIFCKNNVQLTAAQVAAAGKTVAAGDYRGAEFAGACFDPTGRVLFCNVYSPGFTVAITGPWGAGNL
jgi:secreted PhoX family phosphatase